MTATVEIRAGTPSDGGSGDIMSGHVRTTFLDPIPPDLPLEETRARLEAMARAMTGLEDLGGGDIECFDVRVEH